MLVRNERTVAQLAPLCAIFCCGFLTETGVLRRLAPRALHGNHLGLTAELLQDPVVRRRNRVALDWDDAWRLDTGGSDHLDRGWGRPRSGEAERLGKIDVSVRFAARIPVRPVRLIAEGCGLSRAEAERLITEGKLVSAVRLSTKLTGDFTFTLKR
ncbi:DUF1062 domain-containing protein [Streptomyces rugosispiralis]|uniref:DUF1062 domain-containing protein n=1 Tax=Streptomyces rugosispiralis TaxID=2967341 RepID=UPI00273AB021